MNPTNATLDVRVSSKWSEASDICGFELVDTEAKDLPEFSAGSHIDVHVPNGLIRQYSLCNSPDERHRYVIGVLRDPSSRGGSVAMHDQVKEGDALQISTPKNHFSMASGAKKSLLFAGGIGITPILSMAERLSRDNDMFELHYCTRSKDRTAFLPRLEAAKFRRDVHFHFDDGLSQQILDPEACLCPPEAGVHLYVCGPKGFMDRILGCARGIGWPDSQLHYEFFSADIQSDREDTGFEVRIASTGRTITIPPGKKVTKVLAEHGIAIPTSCSQGLCGTCLTGVLEGEPDHRDVYLTPTEREENKKFLPCCSRAKTEFLVLDL